MVVQHSNFLVKDRTTFNVKDLNWKIMKTKFPSWRNIFSQYVKSKMTKIKIILSNHLFSTVKAAKRTKLSQNDLLIMPLNQGVLSGVLGYFYEKSFSQHGIFWKVTAQKPLLKFFACPFCLTFFTFLSLEELQNKHPIKIIHQALAWHMGHSPHPCCQPCKSRKRRLRPVQDEKPAQR